MTAQESVTMKVFITLAVLVGLAWGLQPSGGGETRPSGVVVNMSPTHAELYDCETPVTLEERRILEGSRGSTTANSLREILGECGLLD